ncbi:YopX family protein, partial [Campylobacter upsaliensis]|uniref:YopX family protein n=1 Tax=Campylobacter upsaliensis TaxID=28080 RepID=UPI00214A5814
KMKLKDFDFRVWEVLNKSLVYFNNSNFHSLTNYHFNDDDDEVELYSGILDKNHKKIYEGDIIKFKKDIREYTTLKGVVIFEKCCFYVIDESGSYYRLGQIFDIEILGNIHENKELLND